MQCNYPLQFQQVFRRYLWGGRRLGSVLGKNIGAGKDYAESWEVVDHSSEQSIVSNGPLAGIALTDLLKQYGQELMGRHHPTDRFPLLFKYLDANEALSLQVHPDDSRAAKLDPPDLGKTEAWVVLDRKPGSVIYAGLKSGFDRAALSREVARGTTELCMHKVEPCVGDCLFIPAGVVHALGAGCVIAEIQQSSDTTYRLFDWNRVDTDGKSRPLHVEEALKAIDYDHGPVHPQIPKVTESEQVERLVDCSKFVLDRWKLDRTQMLAGDDRFHIVSVIAGKVELSTVSYTVDLSLGDTVLLPAAIGAVELRTTSSATLLDMYLP